MKINRLVSAITLSIAAVSHAQAATYRVVELPLSDKGVHSFAVDINQTGKIAATILTPFNPPLDYTLINFDNESLANSLTDLESARAGNPNKVDRATLYNHVREQAGNIFFQQLGTIHSFRADANSVSEIIGLDTVIDSQQTLTRSVDTVVTAINASDMAVGRTNGPFRSLDYITDSDEQVTYQINDFIKRGFVSLFGETAELLPPDTTNGGISAAFDINNANEIAGYGSIATSSNYLDRIEDCEDETLRGDQPVDACLQRLRSENDEANFERRGLIWRVDDQGNTLETRQLGLLLTPEADDTRRFNSRAIAINDNGIAVGVSNDYYKGNSTVVGEFAAIFDGDEVIGITDHEEFFSSSATDINNNNVVVGYASKRISGVTRSKFYVHDMDSETTVFPTDFFNSSSSIARAINDHGLVVGEGEIETGAGSQRRRAAFLYDSVSDTFQNINDLIACDAPYTIVQGNGINNDGVIAATAQVFTQARDITGELQTDDNGDAVMQSKTMAVKLVPITGGSIDDCQQQDEVEDSNSGGALGLLWTVPLLLLGFRRLKQR